MDRQERGSKIFSRFDMHSASIVEKGIALQTSVGTRYAAVYLKSESVSAAVMLRVLLRPAERRGIHPASHISMNRKRA